MKQKTTGQNQYSNKHKGSYIFPLMGIVILFFGQVHVGNAQEATPTAESATATEVQVTPTATPEAVETETATPVEKEASTSSEVTQILVKVSSRARVFKVQESLDEYGKIIYVDELEKLGVIVLEVPLDQLDEKIQQLQNITGVGYVEPNYSVQATDVIPNDPGWASQYGLTSIRAPQGWNISTGSSSVTIAILDSGVDLGHADLAGKIVAGYDFVNLDNIPQDDNGHGTHVAGIAAAQGNNGIGVAGVSWNAKIMPLKVLNAFGGGTYAGVAAAIVWAADNGAQVINLSLGGAAPSVTLQTAVLYAYNKGLLVVAATGNSGSNQVLYPAAYPEVMAVGATNFSNQPASFSNYGSEVDIAAPGENIYSLWPGGYFTQSGTSMSAPYVSGLAAVLFSYTSNAATVRSAIESTALDVGPVGWDLYSGAGLIQMDAALAFLIPPTATSIPNNNNGNSGSVNTNGYLILPPSLTPSLTSSPLPDLITVTTTQTLSAQTVPFTATPTAVHMNIDTPTATPMPEIQSQKWKILISPYCFGGFGLIIIGLGLWWFAKRKRRNKYL